MHEIKHIFDGQKGSFYIEVNYQKVATIDYVMENDTKLIIEHTGVDNSLRGLGIGKKLLEKLITYAREKQLLVVPLCSFANAVIKKTPGWQDVLK
jgi:predicted GNAT family acetyltransferase